MEPILKGRGLVKRYGRVTALDNCDFDLMPGEILAVIGDNGAGKSSLIKAVSGAVIPDEGTVTLEGKEVRFTSPIEAREAVLAPGAWEAKDVKVWPLGKDMNAEAMSETHDSLTIPSDLTQERIRDSFGQPDAISIWDLPDYVARLEEAGFSARRHQVWFQMEMARPLFLTAMVLLGAAFTMRHVRAGGTGVAVLTAVMLGFALFYIRNFAQILGENGQIPILLAAWAPPVASVLLALGILLNMEEA